MNFSVSIITPVYNASSFLERAVLSALAQEEVTEVILIEDHSTDDSYEICKTLASKFSQVKLLIHPNHENRGAGASRNLGIEMAQGEFISFLDADDEFLPERFNETKKMFLNDDSVQGVYEPVSCEFVDAESKKKFSELKKIAIEDADAYLSYPTKVTSGTDFFKSLITGQYGYPCTDGITVRRSLFTKSGVFNPTLRLHQDTDLWVRLAYYGKFDSPSSIKPIAKRTQHVSNRITSRNHQSQEKLYSSLLAWAKGVNLDSESLNILKKKYYFHSTAAETASEGIYLRIKWRLRYFFNL